MPAALRPSFDPAAPRRPYGPAGRRPFTRQMPEVTEGGRDSSLAQEAGVGETEVPPLPPRFETEDDIGPLTDLPQGGRIASPAHNRFRDERGPVESFRSETLIQCLEPVLNFKGGRKGEGPSLA